MVGFIHNTWDYRLLERLLKKGINMDLVKKGNTAIVVQKQRLNQGQTMLYKKISEVTDNKETLHFSDAMEIYKTFVLRETRYWPEWGNKSYPYTDWQLKEYCNNWLLRAIGALVKKGYIAMIPMIDLEK